MISSSSYCEDECNIGHIDGLPLHLQSQPICLGKFDALHTGHRQLAIAAASLSDTPFHPWLVSFSNMAAILGWEPRRPLVAPRDRHRVLNSWSIHPLPPKECYIPFDKIRTMSPDQFVRLLAQDIKVQGVVVGANYRFGYKAAGTVDTLKDLGEKYGIKVSIVDLVGETGRKQLETTVSSSVVRKGLMQGDMKMVEDILGRPYRLVINLGDEEGRGSGIDGGKLEVGVDQVENQPPGPGSFPVLLSLNSNKAVEGSLVVHRDNGGYQSDCGGLHIVTRDTVFYQELSNEGGGQCIVNIDFV